MKQYSTGSKQQYVITSTLGRQSQAEVSVDILTVYQQHSYVNESYFACACCKLHINLIYFLK